MGMELAQAYHLCSFYALESNQLFKAIHYAKKQLEFEHVCVGTVHKMDDNAEDWLANLHALAAKNDLRFKAELHKQRKEQERMQKKFEKEAARQASREEAERMKEEENRLSRLKQAREELARQQQEAAEKAARDESRKETEAVKTAVKKAKRRIRAAVQEAKDAEVLIANLSGKDLVALAGKLGGEADARDTIAEALEEASGV